MKQLIVCVLAAGLPVAASVAQSEPLLIVERAADRIERARLTQRLKKVRVDLKLTGEGPVEIADRLNPWTKDVTMFVVKSHEGDRDYASIKIDLKKRSAWQAMSLIRRVSDIRFVFKAGVVMIMHKDDVRELVTLRVYDVRAATFKLRDFPGPKVGVRRGEEEEEDEPEPVESENTPSGVTLEKLEELIRANVYPETWGNDSGASILAQGGLLFIRQTERGHDRVRRLLQQLGIGPSPLRRVVGRRVKPVKKPVKKPAKKKSTKKSSKKRG